MKKVCLLTGAGGRLGTAFCKLYSEKYDIVAVYRNHPPDVASQLQQYVDPISPGADLPENANPVYAVRADLHQEQSVPYVVDIALARFNAVDLLVNAAADLSFLGATCDLNRHPKKVLDQMTLNFLIPARLTAAVVEKYWKHRGDNQSANRSVVNVSSTSGLKIFPLVGQSFYSASKAALNFLSFHLSHELKTLGVRVNILAPTGFPKIIATESVARAVEQLAAGEMNGEILVMDQAGERFCGAKMNTGYYD